MVQSAVKNFGALDICICNAGILRDKSFKNMTADMWDAVIDVHLRGTYLVSKAAYDRMLEQQQGGRIIVTSSTAGLIGNFGQTNYGAAKAGIAGFMRCLWLEGLKYGIQFNLMHAISREERPEAEFWRRIDVDMIGEAFGIPGEAVDGMDVLAVKAWWGHQDMAEVKRLIPGMAIGVVVATLVAGSLDEDHVRLLLGVISLLFVAYMIVKPAASRPIASFWAWPAGIATGITSFIAHAGAPPMNLYLVPRRLPKTTFIATTTLVFAAVNTMKLPPYLWLHVLLPLPRFGPLFA